MTAFRERRRNLQIVKTPEVYINHRSNPDEVQNWLAAKGFSEK
jgi:epidermal growth factor receptor kinase substrate 8